MTADPTAAVRGKLEEQLQFDWVYEGADACDWVRDTEHWPSAMRPMEAWLHRHWAGGIDRAWAEAGMDAPSVFYRFQIAGPFMYARETPYEPERMMRHVMRYREVAREHGGALRFWLEYCRPRVEGACRDLARDDGTMSLLDVAELWAYGFHQTFTSLALLFEPGMRLQALLADAGIDDVAMTALELTQGADNATQAIDAEIWELSEIARRTPAVTRTLAGRTDADALDALRDEAGAREFVAGFDRVIERHGSRAQGWELTQPTWRERPEAVLALVRARLASGGPTPAEVAAASDARRVAATERVNAKLPPEKREQFAKDLARLEGATRIREDRAYWQMTLVGEVRTLLLRRGARLAQRGAIDRGEDVLFLEPDDIEPSPRGDLRATIAEHRQAWERWRGFDAPAHIGTPSAAAQPEPEPEPATGELRGTPASRGIVTGIARVIATPEEGARLRPGDVLVCYASTPAWTPLFGIVAGVITETGGPLSHPAITAREYGIPAVVAVRGATTHIRDGQTVTIDGATGTITLG